MPVVTVGSVQGFAQTEHSQSVRGHDSGPETRLRPPIPVNGERRFVATTFSFS